jgi:hypothetical protein
VSTESAVSHDMIGQDRQDQSSTGRFVILEGADGTGKTTLLRAIREAAAARDRDVVVPSRSQPPLDNVYAGLVKEIARFYADGDDQRLPNRLLLIAAATQYQAMYYGQIAPALDRGAVVITDGWWNKTWSRLVVEEEAVLHGRGQELAQSYTAWASGLFVNEHFDDGRIQTFLVDTPHERRQQWYSAKEDQELVFDRLGRDTRDPADFAWFTEEIQEHLRRMAVEHRWSILLNDGSRSTSELVSQVLNAVLPE